MNAQEVPGLVRRVRREADLNQRELGALLGVSQSVVARWERGEREPTVSMLQRVLALVGWGLEPTRLEGGNTSALCLAPAELPPMREDACRDAMGRRFPAHLDVRDHRELVLDPWRVVAHGRRRRDLSRMVRGRAPEDHPAPDEVVRARRERWEQKLLRQREGARGATALDRGSGDAWHICGP